MEYGSSMRMLCVGNWNEVTLAILIAAPCDRSLVHPSANGHPGDPHLSSPLLAVNLSGPPSLVLPTFPCLKAHVPTLFIPYPPPNVSALSNVNHQKRWKQTTKKVIPVGLVDLFLYLNHLCSLCCLSTVLRVIVFKNLKLVLLWWKEAKKVCDRGTKESTSIIFYSFSPIISLSYSFFCSLLCLFKSGYQYPSSFFFCLPFLTFETKQRPSQSELLHQPINALILLLIYNPYSYFNYLPFHLFFPLCNPLHSLMMCLLQMNNF